MVTRLPTVQPTQEQRDWMDKEKERTGESLATIMKRLIQDKVNKDKRAKK